MTALVNELKPLAKSHFRSASLLGSVFTRAEFKTYLPFCIDGLKLAIVGTSNTDTFQRRIANAVKLLAEADNQRSDAIGLSLSVAAIDALLGKRDLGITKTLADFVAGLLEPEVSLRREAAKWVDQLYHKRSRVLHGEKLEGSADLRRDARRLAASALFGVWSYQGFFQEFHESTLTPDDFFAKLRADFVKPGLPGVIPELPVRALWRKQR